MDEEWDKWYKVNCPRAVFSDLQCVLVTIEAGSSCENKNKISSKVFILPEYFKADMILYSQYKNLIHSVSH